MGASYVRPLWGRVDLTAYSFLRRSKQAWNMLGSSGRGPATVSIHSECETLLRVNMCKAAGPDNIPGSVWRTCANQLADSLLTFLTSHCHRVPTCFKTATIIPVSKTPAVSSLNDYCPVALTSILMKCFKKLVLQHIKNNIPASLDPHQFVFRTNRSTEDTISTALHSVFTHLKNNTSIRMLRLVIQYNHPHETDSTLPSVCEEVQYPVAKFARVWYSSPDSLDWWSHLHSRAQHWAPQGWAPSCSCCTLTTAIPDINRTLLRSLRTTPPSLVGLQQWWDLILEENQQFAEWCTENNLLLKVSKTKELIIAVLISCSV